MKILIFNWQDCKNPDAGGAEVHMHEIFSRVAAKGHEVTLFCSSFSGASKQETIRGINVIREGGRYLFNFHVAFRYWKQFRHQQYDVVFDDMNKIPFFTPLFVHKPLFGIIHHLFDKSIFLETLFPLAFYVYIMERAAVAVFRRCQTPLLVVSPSTRDELLEKNISKEHIDIVYNCVDHDAYRPGEGRRSATPLIGYFGRLKKYKSVEHLLHAFVIVKKNYPDAELIVVGEGDRRPALEQLASQLGIGKNVRFTGFVSEEEKVRLLQQVWFVVNTSSKEGWGLTVIEANACRTAVIGSNVPGLRDAIQHEKTGLLYEYGNIQELSNNIEYLLNDSSARKRLADAAYDWSLTFDWNIMAEHVISLCQQRIANKR